MQEADWPICEPDELYLIEYNLNRNRLYTGISIKWVVLWASVLFLFW